MEAPPSEVRSQVNELRKMLEGELDRRDRPLAGCWPLLAAVAGLLLGILLLLRAR